MKDKPVIVSLLSGLIVVLVIAGVSVLVKMNNTDELYNEQVATNLKLQKKVEQVKEQNLALEAESQELSAQVETLQTELMKLEKLKEKLEENLKEELIDSPGQ